MPAINYKSDEEGSKKKSRKEVSDEKALKDALAKMKEEVVKKSPKEKPVKGKSSTKLINSTDEKEEKEEKEEITPGEKVLNKTIKYKIVLDNKTKEADLHFSLENSVEDRYFAYVLTLMDLLYTMEDIKKTAPPSVVAEFETALQVLKRMSEKAKKRIEEESGFTKLRFEGESKEGIKKMIESIKGKIEKKFPGSRVSFTQVNNESELPDIIKSIVKEIEKEIKDGKRGKLKDEVDEPRKPSKDLEF
jgi:hypothetical protein